MIEKWNSSFGTAEILHYPTELEKTLLRLHPYVELELPGLETVEFDKVSSLVCFESGSNYGA